MVSIEEGIAIAEIAVYIPIFFLTLIVIFRHGFQRQLGWIYLGIFCAVRLAGAGFKIESTQHPDNSTDKEWSFILQSVGLSPLLMASLGLLKRVTDECSNHVKSENSILSNMGGSIGVVNIISKRATANSRRSRIIQILQLPTTIALILCVVGGIDEADSSPSKVSTGKKDTKIGIIIFLCIYIALCLLAIITMKDVGKVPRTEKRVFFAVLAAIPLLAVRLLWSLLAAFSHNPDFSLVDSKKPLIQLFMAVLMEFVIVCFYTTVGLLAGRD